MDVEVPTLSHFIEAFRRQEQELIGEAEVSRKRKIESLQSRLDGNDPQAFLDLVGAYESGRQYRLALETLRVGLKRCAPDRKLFRTAIQMLAEGNRTEEAIAFAREAETLFPGDRYFPLIARLLLPIVYQTPEEIEIWRTRFAQGLRELPSVLAWRNQNMPGIIIQK
jgi:hypothetical protein